MVNAKTLALFALSDITLATVAPNFPIAGGQRDLGLAFGSNTVSPPGELIPRPETVNAPNITTSTLSSGDRAVVMIVDLDVPRNNTRVQLLHYLGSNVTIARDNNTRLILPSNPEAPYRQPSPPVGDVPHAYTVFLFPQPRNFSIPPAFAQVLLDRVPFNTSAFAKSANLGDPLAANYFRVQNTSGPATTTFPPPASGPASTGKGNASTSGPSQFPGAAAGLSVAGEKAWFVGMGVMILAGLMGFVL